MALPPCVMPLKTDSKLEVSLLQGSFSKSLLSGSLEIILPQSQVSLSENPGPSVQPDDTNTLREKPQRPDTLIPSPEQKKKKH